jgi:hypothetical protein
MALKPHKSQDKQHIANRGIDILPRRRKTATSWTIMIVDDPTVLQSSYSRVRFGWEIAQGGSQDNPSDNRPEYKKQTLPFTAL